MHAGHCDGCWYAYLSPLSSRTQRQALVFPFHREHWGSEKLRELPEVSQLVKGKNKELTQASMTGKLMLLHNIPNSLRREGRYRQGTSLQH